MVLDGTATSFSPKTSDYRKEMTSDYWSQSLTGGFGLKGAASTQYIMPYVRNNRDYRDRKQMEVYVNDSTHSNPSDPNTMTDQGQIRNAPYTLDTRAYNSQGFDGSQKLSMSQTWKGFPQSSEERPSTSYVSGSIKNRDVINQGFYRFGGKTPIGKHVTSQEEVPKLNSTFTTMLSQKLKNRIAEYNESK